MIYKEGQWVRYIANELLPYWRKGTKIEIVKQSPSLLDTSHYIARANGLIFWVHESEITQIHKTIKDL